MAVRKLVEDYNILGLYKLVEEGGIGVLNQLYSWEESTYPNAGTIMHWAIWDRHWDIISFCAACGANFQIKGQGSWMANKTPAEYASFLQSKTNHKYFSYVKEFNCAIKEYKNSIITIPFMEKFNQWDATATINSTSTKTRLYDLIALNCIDGIKLALEKFGAKELRNVKLCPVEYKTNTAPLAFWAVWFDHFELLEFLFKNNCVDLTLKGEGRGWTGGNTLQQYTALLETNTGHSYHNFVTKLSTLVSKYGNFTEEMEEDDDDENKNTCVICLSNEPNFAIVPCGHRCLCTDCEKVTLHECPLCKGAINCIIRIFG